MKKVISICLLCLTTLLATGQIIVTDGTGSIITSKGNVANVRFSKNGVVVSPDNRSIIVSCEVLTPCHIYVDGVESKIMRGSGDANWIYIKDIVDENGKTQQMATIASSLPANATTGRQAMLFLSADEAIHIIQVPMTRLEELSVERTDIVPASKSVIQEQSSTNISSTTTLKSTDVSHTHTDTQSSTTTSYHPGSITTTTTSGVTQTPSTTKIDTTGYKITQTLGPGSITNLLFGFKNSENNVKVVDTELYSGDMFKYSMTVAMDSKRFPLEDALALPINQHRRYTFSTAKRAQLDYYWNNTRRTYILAQPGKVSDKERDETAKHIVDIFIEPYFYAGEEERESKMPEGFKAPNAWKDYSICYDFFVQRMSSTKGLTLFEKYLSKNPPKITKVEFMGDKNATLYSLDINLYDGDLQIYGFLLTPITFRHEIYSFYNEATNTTCWSAFIRFGYDIAALKKYMPPIKGTPMSMYDMYDEHVKTTVVRKNKDFSLEAYALEDIGNLFEKSITFFKHGVAGKTTIRSKRVVGNAIKDSTINVQIANAGDSITSVEPIVTSIQIGGQTIPWSSSVTIISPPVFGIVSESTTTSTTHTATKTEKTTKLDTTRIVKFKRIDIKSQLPTAKPTTPKFKFIAVGNVSQIVDDAKNLYVTSIVDYKYCLVVVDKTTGAMRTAEFSDGIKKLLIDKKGRLIICSYDGVRVWDGTSKESSKLLISSSKEGSRDYFPVPLSILPSGNILGSWNRYDNNNFVIIDPITGEHKRTFELTYIDNYDRKRIVNKYEVTPSGLIFGGQDNIEMLFEGIESGDIKVTPLKDLGYNDVLGFGSYANQTTTNKYKSQVLFATGKGLIGWDDDVKKFDYVVRGNQFSRVVAASGDKLWAIISSPFTAPGSYGYSSALALFDFSVGAMPTNTVTDIDLPLTKLNPEAAADAMVAMPDFSRSGAGVIYTDTAGNVLIPTTTGGHGLIVYNPNGIIGYSL